MFGSFSASKVGGALRAVAVRYDSALRSHPHSKAVVRAASEALARCYQLAAVIAPGSAEASVAALQLHMHDPCTTMGCCEALAYEALHIDGRANVVAVGGPRALVDALRLHAHDVGVARLCCLALSRICKTDEGTAAVDAEPSALALLFLVGSTHYACSGVLEPMMQAAGFILDFRQRRGGTVAAAGGGSGSGRGSGSGSGGIDISNELTLRLVNDEEAAAMRALRGVLAEAAAAVAAADAAATGGRGRVRTALLRLDDDDDD